MRAAIAVVVALAPVALVAACTDPPPDGDVCAQAATRVESCGATLTFVTNGACTGVRKLVARCIVDHAHDCDELAGLYRELDACVAGLADGGDDLLPPVGDLPVEGHDAGAARDGAVDAAPPPVDVPDATDDAAIDAAKEAS